MFVFISNRVVNLNQITHTQSFISQKLHQTKRGEWVEDYENGTIEGSVLDVFLVNGMKITFCGPHAEILVSKLSVYSAIG